MSTSTEFEIKVSEGKIILPKNLPDGVYKRVVEVETPATKRTVVSQQYGEFVKIPASELSLEEDWFKKHQPKTYEEEKFKKLVKNAIQRGLKDFWRPKYDPSFNKDGSGICYLPNKQPAVGKSYSWWRKTAKDFMPTCKSRLGTKTEYIAFLAVLIKKLVASGWQLEDAWHGVCKNSIELGHYWNSQNAKHAIEHTGCREICGFYDLANTCKILEEDEENYLIAGGFWLASGCSNYNSFINPLADLFHIANPTSDCYYNITGWLVLESNPEC